MKFIKIDQENLVNKWDNNMKIDTKKQQIDMTSLDFDEWYQWINKLMFKDILYHRRVSLPKKADGLENLNFSKLLVVYS
jgi:hypothetical protein